VRAYGTEAAQVMGNATKAEDLGQDFGATLTAREVTWMMRREYAKRAEDIVWRRTRLGLRMTKAQIKALDDWMTSGEAMAAE
jgi:glycerol-3-phosphate dehydrogenase